MGVRIMIDRFAEWANNTGLIVQRADEPISFSEGVLSRYKNIPEEWFKFMESFNSITNEAEDVYFLTIDYFADNCSYFEDISLDAADGDDEWTASIKAFWDKTLPIVMGVGGDYHYYAIDLETGEVVEGWEPEFEDTSVVAGSFYEFLEKLMSGEIVLGI